MRAAVFAAVLMLGCSGSGGIASAESAAAKRDITQEDAAATALVEQSRAYLTDKQAGRYDRAYAMIAPGMRSYLTLDLFRDGAANFAAQAGKPGETDFTRFTWYRDPPDAPEPGLYAAVDFTGHYDNLVLMCGYLMWHQLPGGAFRLVREEQNFIDRPGAQQMVPEQRRKLPELFGCVTS